MKEQKIKILEVLPEKKREISLDEEKFIKLSHPDNRNNVIIIMLIKLKVLKTSFLVSRYRKISLGSDELSEFLILENIKHLMILEND